MSGKKRALVAVCVTLAAAAAVGGTLATAHGGPPAGRAGRTAQPPLARAGSFIVQMIEAKATGRFDAAWQALYPAHQLVAPRTVYVSCERTQPFPGTLMSIQALRTTAAEVSVAGRSRLVPGAAVTVRAIVASPLLPAPLAITHTFHAVPVGGRWTWILSASRFRLYSSGGCGVSYSA